jgi:hypothetical protein
MADSAGEVVGIDHQQSRIDTAETTRARLGYSNVTFKVADIRDPGFLDEMGRFDLVVAWGFLHRVPDIFTLLLGLSEIADAFSLEWATPLFPFMGRSVSARHRGPALDRTNLRPLGSMTAAEITAQKVGGLSGYWFPTPCAVASVLKKCGVEHSRILGYGEPLMSQSEAIVRSLHDVLRGRAYARVHMLAERAAGSIAMNDSYTLPAWDTAAREYLGQ